jgi:hypothetical protein
VPRPAADRSAPVPSPVHVSGAGVRRALQAKVTLRRRVFVTMAVVVLGSLPMAVFAGGRLRWLPAMTSLCILGYAAGLRRQAVRDAQRRHRIRQLALERKVEQEHLAYLRKTGQPVPAPVPAMSTVRSSRAGAGAAEPSAYGDAEALPGTRRVVGE